MQDTAYRKRLAADLPKWLDAGWVNADGATAILSSLAAVRRSTFGFSAILGTLGALLLGLAVLAYVGAQWEEVPRIVRFGLVGAAMFVAYAAAFQFERRDLRIFAEAGILAAGLIYAGAIALVGQTYHLSGDFGGAVLLFEAGIVGAALLTGSPTMNVLGLLGAGYWTWFSTYDHGVVPHWPSLIAIGVGILVSTVQNSHYGRIVAVIAFMFWVTITLMGFATEDHWSFAGGLGLFTEAALATWALGAALAAVRPEGRIAALGEAVLWPGLLAVLVTLGIVQLAEHPMPMDEGLLLPMAIGGGAAIAFAGIAFVQKGLTALDFLVVVLLAVGTLGFAVYLPDDDLTRKIVGGVIVIAASLWAVALGQSGKHPIGKSIGLVAFGLEVIYLYVFTIGTRLDTALAFLVGGLLFIALSFVLFRIDRLLGRRAAVASAASVVVPEAMAARPSVPTVATVDEALAESTPIEDEAAPPSPEVAEVDEAPEPPSEPPPEPPAGEPDAEDRS